MDDFDPLLDEEDLQKHANPDPDWLLALNDEQQKALKHLDGPTLILAGAGTGKTRVLCARFAQIVRLGLAQPWQILCVTFTNKAANEMRQRIEHLLSKTDADKKIVHSLQSSQIWLGTFHSICARMLRYNHALAGLERDFIILNSDDQTRLIKRLITESGIDEAQNPARLLSHHISLWKDKALDADHITPEMADPIAGGKAAQIYKKYQQTLLQNNSVDFGDLILHILTILKQHQNIVSEWQNRFKYILVDEYQDTNAAQYLWLRLLSQSHHNLCCVGDDDQSIYGWRGAEIANILQFEKDFPNAQIIKLERNYRSTSNILKLASTLISHNQSRLGKTLWTDNDKGELPIVKGVWDGVAEAHFIAQQIRSLQHADIPKSQIAILVRMGFQTREFEECFINQSIPYHIFGGRKFYEREEIRDIIAYMRLIHQPKDNLAFERIINKPRRGIGQSSLKIIFSIAQARQCSFFQAAIIAVEELSLPPAALKSVSAFITMINQWHKNQYESTHLKITEEIIEKSGYLAMLDTLPPLDKDAKLENLKELIVAMEQYHHLSAFLEHVSLVSDNDNTNIKDKVLMMTLHAAKGLEFDTVFLPGWEEGIFPSQRALSEKGVSALEEERRLAYVGLTRAQRQAYISFAASRRVHGKWMSAMPSRFIMDLPKNLVTFVYETGMGNWNQAQKQHTQQPQSGYRKAYGGYQNRAARAAHKSLRTNRQITDAHQFKVGDKCFHQKFGPGKILQNHSGQLHIRFAYAGDKHIMASFVKPA
ncbi:MAG: UvrD-helicase domain-containing protein [Pseudomonadota bacterium]